MEILLTIIKLLIEERKFLFRHFFTFLKSVNIIIISNYFFVRIYGKHEFSTSFSEAANFFVSGYFFKPLLVLVSTFLVAEFFLEVIIQLTCEFVFTRKDMKLVRHAQKTKAENPKLIVAFKRLTYIYLYRVFVKNLNKVGIQISLKSATKYVGILLNKNLSGKIDLILLIMWQMLIIRNLLYENNWYLTSICLITTFVLAKAKARIEFGKIFFKS